MLGRKIEGKELEVNQRFNSLAIEPMSLGFGHIEWVDSSI